MTAVIGNSKVGCRHGMDRQRREGWNSHVDFIWKKWVNMKWPEFRRWVLKVWKLIMHGFLNFEMNLNATLLIDYVYDSFECQKRY